MPSPQPKPKRLSTKLIGKAEVCARVGVTFPTIWRWMREGYFPRSRRINSPNSKSVRVAWYEHEVEAWIANLPLQTFKGDK